MKTNKIRIIAVRGGHAIFAVILVAIVCLVTFSINIRKTFSDYAIDELNDYVRESANNISRRMVAAATSSDFLCRYSVETDLEENDICKSLDAIVQTTDCHQAMFVTPDMKAVDYEGESYDLSSSEYAYIFNSDKRGYYYTKNDGVKGAAFIICNPAVNSEGTVTGYVVEFISTDIIIQDIAFDNCYSYAFYSVFDSECNSLIIAGNDTYSEFCKGNLVANVEASIDKKGVKWSVITNDIKKGIQRSFHASMGDDGRQIVHALIQNTGMSLIVFIRDSYIDYEVDSYFKSVKSIIIEFSVCLVLFVILYAVIMIYIFRSTGETKKELEGKAETDLLTGVNNKLATESKIAQYIADNPEGMGVFILIDVDNFKKINDTMGHAFGDEVLRNLGQRLKALYRSTDIIGRIGGDEFVVFLKDIKDMAIIEREARKLETFFKDFKVGEYVKYTVTGSLGASIYSMDGKSFESLYKNADKALYESKHKGKKQLSFYNAQEKDFPKKDAQ